MNSPTTIEQQRLEPPCAREPQSAVGALLRERFEFADEEREAHIVHCTHLMELAWDRWERDGNFADRGDADRWRMLRDEAIRSRSPEQVARMEAERGLR